MKFNDLPLLDNYQKIILSNRQIIDVRAPIEFDKGSFPNSINIPLLNNEEREKIGIIYKKNGHEAAFSKGLELFTEDKKNQLLKDLQTAIDKNPDSILCCFRGGDRSKIVQQLIYDNFNITMPRIKGGSKAMRSYLIESLTEQKLNLDFYLLAGHTGCGKTLTINKCPLAIDLEGIANHRGSTFGAYQSPQPTQINFENELARQIIVLQAKGQKKLILEKEGKLIGRNRLPEEFYQKMLNSPIIVLQTSLSERVDITYNDYVVNDIKKYEQLYGDEGRKIWQDRVISSAEKLTRRFGGDRTNNIITMFKNACQKEDSAHKEWIEILLRDYYDPMYDYQRSKWQSPIIFEGRQAEVLEFIDSL